MDTGTLCKPICSAWCTYKQLPWPSHKCMLTASPKFYKAALHKINSRRVTSHQVPAHVCAVHSLMHCRAPAHSLHLQLSAHLASTTLCIAPPHSPLVNSQPEHYSWSQCKGCKPTARAAAWQFATRQCRATWGLPLSFATVRCWQQQGGL